MKVFYAFETFEALSGGISRSLGSPGGYDVFLLAGQSNMTGWEGPINEILDSINNRILEFGYNSETVVVASDPLEHRGYIPADTVGLGLSFAKSYLPLVSGRRDILLVPVAEGGTGFSTGYWRSGGIGYNGAISKANLAMATDEGNVFKGILWNQGEADNASSEAVYATDLDNLIDGLRAGINGASVETPFVLAKVNVNSSEYAEPVALATEDTVNRKDNVRLVPDTNDLTLVSSLHYEPLSARLLGNRYYNALISSALTISNFKASDNQGGQVTVTFSGAIGSPTYNLYEDGVNVATGITSGYVRSVGVGTYEYKVLVIDGAENEFSNTDNGTSLTQSITALIDYGSFESTTANNYTREIINKGVL